MNGETRRPRTRGPRRGRGVRVRGGRGAAVVVAETAVVDAYGRGRGRGRGSRGGRGGSGLDRPGPYLIDQLVIRDISDLPLGQALEARLHPKRPRVWQPTDQILLPAPSPLLLPPMADQDPSPERWWSPAPEPQASSVPSQGPGSERSWSPAPERPASSVPSQGPGPERSWSPAPEPPASSVPSPALFVECSGSPRSTPSGSDGAVRCPLSRSHEILNTSQIEYAVNYGSEPSSDESDDEEELMPVFLPRTFRSVMETPMDPVDEPAVEHTAAHTTITAAIEPATIVFEPLTIVNTSASTTQVALTATDQPWSFHDFHWEAFPASPIQPVSRRECFSQTNVGPTIQHVDPYDIFVTIWDRHFMEHIALETNRYAQQVAEQMIHDHNLHPNSRITQWADTSVDELYLYFAITLAMGVVVKSRLEEYWSNTADIFYTPGFRAHMSYNRFILLHKCLHFNNNHDMCASELTESEAKLFKINPVLAHLNEKFQLLYNLDQNISLDESLLMWKGWLDINQLIPNKAATVGIKTYEICESQTGYLWRFEVHAHKRSPQQHNPEDPLNASTPAIVLRLLHGLEKKGHTVWMDNFYNSPLLARRLKTLGFDCVGTLRTNRRFVPQALHSLNKVNMRPGQLTGLTSGDIDVMVWRDNNRVAMISTYHGNAVSQANHSTKPILILDYNIMMGGVDKKDQMLAMFPVERKRTRIWYKKLFRRLLNVSVLNSYIIHKKSSSLPLNHRTFRTNLIRSILKKHCPGPSLLPSLPPATSPVNVPVNVTHRIADYALRNRQRQRRLCVVCKKRVHTYCFGCNKTVCNGTCFLNIHS